MPLFSLLLAVAILQGNPADPQSGKPPSGDTASSQASQSSSASTSSVLDSLVSIDRIRREIEREPKLSFRMPDPSQARFQVEIQGYRYRAEHFPEDFVIAKSPVPMPIGGADHYEMMRLITPPQYWGSAPFNNADLLKMWGLTGAYGLAGALIKKGIDASARARDAQLRDEVRQELEQVEAHNALVRAGLSDDGGKKAEAKKAADKKAAEKKKKKKDKDNK
jgi:hypothetical protein